MKGLYRYLSPFSPDQSGAVAVLYELGGIIVIWDAGGCAGNICGFDEPRWGHKQSAVYSAGIRDLDAILGRDERTIEKIGGAVAAVDANFIALVATPVPAIVGTDLRAMCRLCEKKFGLPAIPVETYGMEYFDKGEELCYMELLHMLEHGLFDEQLAKRGAARVADVLEAKKAAGAASEPAPVHIGVLGATPLELPAYDSPEHLRQRIAALEGVTEADVYIYGMDSGFEDLPLLFTASKNYVVSPSGLKPAKYLKDRYGIPFVVDYPLAAPGEAQSLAETLTGAVSGGKVLILHQQVYANSIRNELVKTGLSFDDITVGSFFQMSTPRMAPQDRKFKGEDEFIAFLKEENFDVILGDPMYKMALKWWDGEFLPLPQYSVSGEAHQLLREADLFQQ